MVFNTLDEVELFHKNYGKAGGFDVRSSTTNFRKEKLISKTFVCSKEGESKGMSSETRRCGTSRTSCKALIRVKIDQEQKV